MLWEHPGTLKTLHTHGALTQVFSHTLADQTSSQNCVGAYKQCLTNIWHSSEFCFICLAEATYDYTYEVSLHMKFGDLSKRSAYFNATQLQTE